MLNTPAGLWLRIIVVLLMLVKDGQLNLADLTLYNVEPPQPWLQWRSRHVREMPTEP